MSDVGMHVNYVFHPFCFVVTQRLSLLQSFPSPLIHSLWSPVAETTNDTNAHTEKRLRISSAATLAKPSTISRRNSSRSSRRHVGLFANRNSHSRITVIISMIHDKQWSNPCNTREGPAPSFASYPNHQKEIYWKCSPKFTDSSPPSQLNLGNNIKFIKKLKPFLSSRSPLKISDGNPANNVAFERCALPSHLND